MQWWDIESGVIHKNFNRKICHTVQNHREKIFTDRFWPHSIAKDKNETWNYFLDKEFAENIVTKTTHHAKHVKKSQKEKVVFKHKTFTVGLKPSDSDFILCFACWDYRDAGLCSEGLKNYITKVNIEPM
jgi:hypothetical protein